MANQDNLERGQAPASRTSKRGFASMDPARQKEIASKGGRAAHEKGTAHEFTSAEAAAAGRKGGQASGRRRTGNSSSLQNNAEIGNERELDRDTARENLSREDREDLIRE